MEPVKVWHRPVWHRRLAGGLSWWHRVPTSVLGFLVGIIISGSAQELRWRSDLSPIRAERDAVIDAHRTWGEQVALSASPLPHYAVRMADCIHWAASTPMCQALDINQDGIVDEVDQAILVDLSRKTFEGWYEALLREDDPVAAARDLNSRMARLWPKE